MGHLHHQASHIPLLSNQALRFLGLSQKVFSYVSSRTYPSSLGEGWKTLTLNGIGEIFVPCWIFIHLCC